MTADDLQPPAPSGPDESADLGGKVRRSVVWIAVEKWGVRLSTLVVFALLSRLLEPGDFGLIALATVFVALLSVFVDSGFSQAIIQRAQLDVIHSSTAFWVSLALSAGLALLLCATAPMIGAATGEDQLVTVLQVLSLSLPLTALSTVPASLLQRRFGFRELAIRRVVATLAGATAAIALAVAGAGVWALVGQVLTTSVVSVIVLWSVSDWRPSFTISRRAARDLWAVGTSVLGIELVALTNTQADKLLVGMVAGPTKLGYYFVGSRIVQFMLELLTSVTGSVALPTFSRMQDDLPRIRRTLYRFTFLSSAIAFPAFALAAALAPSVIPLVFGDQWSDSVAVMQWLVPSAALTAIAWFDKGLFIGAGRPRVALRLTIGQTALGLALLAAAVPFGIVAVAMSRSASRLLFWPVRLRTLRRHMGVETLSYTRQFVGPAVAALVAAGAVAAWQQSAWTIASDLVATVALGALGVGIYLGLLTLVARDDFRSSLVTVLGTRAPARWRAEPAARG